MNTDVHLKRTRHQFPAFSLVELVIVIVIIGVIASIAVTRVSSSAEGSAESALRSQFVARWRALARRPDFRAGLVAHMRSHPEWDRIVFPEKYLPKRPPPTPGAPRPASGRPGPGRPA